MTRKLRSVGNDEFGRMLIESARLDRAPAPMAVRRGIVRALTPLVGATASAGALATSRAAAAALQKAISGGAVGTSVKFAGSSLVLKCAIAGVCVATATVGTYRFVHAPKSPVATDSSGRKPTRPVRPASASNAQAPLGSVVAKAAPDAVNAPNQPETSSRESIDSPPSIDAPRSAATPGSTKPPNGAREETRASALTAEIGALDRARHAVSVGDGQQALRALDDYQRAYPAGHLMPEAFYLRVQALISVGDLRTARDVAARALQVWPDNPKADELRRLTGLRQSP